MDNELFALCKEVYEKTGWAETQTVFDGEFNLRNPVFNTKDMYFADETPLYTSDYLLEKLPAGIQISKNGAKAENNYEYTTFITGWAAIEAGLSNDPPDFGIEQHAATPLKALLRLTIALHEAGELKAPHKNERNK